MSLCELEIRGWAGAVAPQAAETALVSLERGDVIFLPHVNVAVEESERSLFTPAILGRAKNASFDPATDQLTGTSLAGVEAERLRRLMRRFSDSAEALVARLVPRYAERLVRARASFRPAEIAGRAVSRRKDDTRLHVDSFPATPSGGRRILRLFANVNPAGRGRVWRIGDDFDAVAMRFAPRLRLPLPGVGRALALLRITKSRRTAYDALMRQLHDRMKEDRDFQSQSPQQTVVFPAGSTWLAFTDQVSHAAMSGQYQLEQTFLLPIDTMREPDRSPLRVLERITHRKLT